MKIILVGPPASGKGTLAQRLTKDFDIPHISTGEIFRENIKNNTELGKKVKTYLDSGALVPDNITVEVVKQRLEKDDCKNGFILDGFPRNLEQAKALDDFVKIDFAIHLNVELDEIEKRILGRRTCSICGQIYNTQSYNSEKCECGGDLYQRKEDTIETIRKRYYDYRTETVPLLEHYKDILVSFEGKGLESDAYESVKKFLEKEERKQ